MTPIASVLAARAVVTAALALGSFIAAPGDANAFGLRVKMSCASDYYKHCSSHSLGSPGVRSCMRAVGAGLSHGCVDALVAAGEVSADEVARRRGVSKTASRTP